MDTPLVSVIIGHYDNQEFLPQAIESVLDQSYEPVEVVLVDSSGEVDHLADDHDNVRYYVQEERGASAKWNKGIEEANGEFIAFLGADDYLRRDRFEVQVPVLRYDDYEIVYADQFLVRDGTATRDESMDLDPDTEPYVQFFRQWGGVGTLTVLVRAHCLKDERFDTTLEANEDYHLWVRLFKQFRVAKLAEPVTYKRVLSDALTSDHEMVYRNAIQASDDLMHRFPELREYRDEVRWEIYQRFGMWLMRDGEWEPARRLLRKAVAINTDPKTIVVLLICSLPVPDEIRKSIVRYAVRLNSFLP